MKAVRKYLALFLSAAIVATGIGADNMTALAEELRTLPTPNVSWSSTKIGDIEFTVSDGNNSVTGGDEVEVAYQLSRNGETLVDGGHWTLPVENLRYFTESLCTSHRINESGDYTARIKYLGNGSTTQDSEWSEEKVFTYVRPENEVAQPANVRWSQEEKGVLLWDGVENAGGYYVELFRDGQSMGGSWWHDSEPLAVREHSRDLTRNMQEPGVYTAEVTALSYNINLFANGKRALSDELNTVDISGEVNEKLDNILAGYAGMDKNQLAEKKEEIAQAVEGLAGDTSLPQMAVAMQTNADTLDKMTQLEKVYSDSNHITVENRVSDEVASLLDPGKVNIVGAALNAGPNTGMSFNLSKPDAGSQVSVDSNLYKKAIQFEMNLDGVTGGSLRLPVRVTIPIPNGIAPADLAILHYHADGSYERVRPYIDYEAGTAAFTVTRFSIFVFAEKGAEDVDDGKDDDKDNDKGDDNQGSGDTGNGEDGDINWDDGNGNINSGGSESGQKSWTPTTKEEIYRYSLWSSLPVTFTASSAAGYQVGITSEVQGNKYIEAVKSVQGSWQPARTYNILLDNQKLHHSEVPVRIVMNIPGDLAKDGRSYAMICVDENGIPHILADEDQNADTITFTTQNFYAFTLCYQEKK